MSGAPKIRAIEIIESLERSPRGPYGGALGYFDFKGNSDMCIVIRSIMADDQHYHVQAGAGVVADSDPIKEHEECRHKATGVLLACFEDDKKD